MIKLYILNTKEIKKYEQYLPYLGKVRLERLAKINNKAKIKESILSECLVKYSLIKEGILLDQINLKYDKKGKPSYHKSFNVSISHSKDIIVVGLSKNLVGVDAEYLAERHISLAPKILSSEEYQDYLKNEDKVDSFYRYWSAKESFLKMLGIGIVDNIAKVVYHDDKIKYDNKIGHIKTIKFDDYMVSCCSDKLDAVVSDVVGIKQIEDMLEIAHIHSMIK